MSTKVCTHSLVVSALHYAGDLFRVEGIYCGNPFYHDLPKAHSFIWPIFQDIIEEIKEFFSETLGKIVTSIEEVYMEYEENTDIVIAYIVAFFENEMNSSIQKISIIKNKDIFKELLQNLSLISSLKVFTPKFQRNQKVFLLDSESKEPVSQEPMIIDLIVKRNNEYFYLLRGFPIEEDSEIPEHLLIPYNEINEF